MVKWKVILWNNHCIFQCKPNMNWFCRMRFLYTRSTLQVCCLNRTYVYLNMFIFKSGFFKNVHCVFIHLFIRFIDFLKAIFILAMHFTFLAFAGFTVCVCHAFHGTENSFVYRMIPINFQNVRWFLETKRFFHKHSFSFHSEIILLISYISPNKFDEAYFVPWVL